MLTKNEIIFLPDSVKGEILNATQARDGSDPKFYLGRGLLLLVMFCLMVLMNLMMDELFEEQKPELIALLFPWFNWLSGIAGIVVVIAHVVQWLGNVKDAARLKGELLAKGIDMDSLSSDWVFETLILPMIRKRGVTVSDD